MRDARQQRNRRKLTDRQVWAIRQMAAGLSAGSTFAKARIIHARLVLPVSEGAVRDVIDNLTFAEALSHADY